MYGHGLVYAVVHVIVCSETNTAQQVFFGTMRRSPCAECRSARHVRRASRKAAHGETDIVRGISWLLHGDIDVPEPLTTSDWAALGRMLRAVLRFNAARGSRTAASRWSAATPVTAARGVRRPPSQSGASSERPHRPRADELR